MCALKDFAYVVSLQQLIGRRKWCRGVVVKHSDSQQMGCLFDSSMCHF